MSIKDYLLQIKNINARLKQIELEIADIEAKLGVQGIRYDKDGGFNPSGEDKMSKYVYRLIELKDRYEAEGNRLLDKKEEIIENISKLEDFRLRQVLYLRYVATMKWEEISERLGYEDRYIYKLHGYALEELRRTLKDSISV